MYPRVSPCDEYDAVNLIDESGPSIYFAIDDDLSFFSERPNASLFNSGDDFYNAIKSRSNEGDTPIKYFEFSGHSGTDGVSISSRSGNNAMFIPALFGDPNLPSPDALRAWDRKGPQRCWFSRHAKGYAVACGANGFANDFARYFLRDNARIYWSSMLVENYRWRILSMNAWFFRNPSTLLRTPFYWGLDGFLANAPWEFTFGRL